MLTRRSATPSAFLACLMASTAASADPAALWTFDQPGDLSPGVTRGSLVGGAVSGDATQRQIGAGAYFGNNGSYVSGGGPPPNGSAGWSISSWIRSDADTGTTDAICSWMRPGGGIDSFALRNNSGRVFFEANTTGYQWSPTTVFNQQWHHLTLTSLNGGAPFTLYMDGVAAGNPATSTITRSFDLDPAFRIGASLRRGASTASDWDGWIDDFGVVNRTLSAAEVALIHGLGRLGIGLAEFSGARPLLSAPAGTVAIIAGKSWEAIPSGLAGVAGSVAGSLAAGDAAITVATGSGLRMLPAPSPLRDFTSSPASFAATVGTGGSQRFQLQLNQPVTDSSLRWMIAAPAGEMPSLAAIDARLDLALPAITAAVSGLTTAMPGLSGGPYMSSIAYQGLGNRHAYRSAEDTPEIELPLSGVAGVQSQSRGSGPSATKVDHIQRAGPGYFVMSADFQSVSQLRVTGVLKNLPSPAYHSSSFPLTVHGIPWKVWIHRISTAERPVIHHVFLTPPDASIQGSAQSTSAEDFLLTGLPAQTRFHHLWFIRDFDVLGDEVLLEAARAFLRNTHSPDPWLRFSAVTGSVPANSTGDVALDLDAAGLAPGIHQDRFAVIPAGTDVTEAPASRFHDARLEVLPPEFTATGPAAGLTLLSGIQHRAQKITLNPAAGFSFSGITATSDAAWLRALPSENRIGEIDLVFDTTELAPGIHRARITVTAGQTVQIVEIQIEIRHPQIRQILADPFRDRMYLLHEGTRHWVDSRILVVKASDGTFIREIDVSHVYRIAQAPDGKRLYGLRQPDHAIVPIDLQRMLVEAPLVPPAGVTSDTYFGDLEAGENGVLYFLTRASAGTLLAYDTRTAKLFQKIESPQDATASFSRIKLSPDRKELWATQVVHQTFTGQIFTGPFQVLTRYAIGTDGLLTPLPAISRRILDLPNLNRDLKIVTDTDGDPVAIYNMTFDPTDPATTTRFHREEIRAMAPDGEFLVGKAAVYSRDGVRKLRDMPPHLELEAVAVSPEGHVFHAGHESHGFFDLIDTLGAPAAGFHEFPGDGEIAAIPGEFRWLPVDGTREYRVHFARSAGALATVTPAAGTVSRNVRHYRVDSPIPTADGETWFWRVDALTPGGLVPGRVRSFTAAAAAPEITRLQSDVVQGCIAQPLDLGLPPNSPWQATASDRPWLLLPESPGDAARIDSRLATTDHDQATLTLTHGSRSLNVVVDLRVWRASHVDLLADGVNGRVFALVSTPNLEPGDNDQANTDFVVRLDPATGDLLECFPVGARSRSMALSLDGNRLAVDSGGLEIFNVADGSRSLAIGSLADDINPDTKIRTAFGPGGRLLVYHTLLDEANGQVLAKGDRLTPGFSHFSPDGGFLYGADADRVYRHDANSPTLAQTHDFQTGVLGYDRLMMTEDGSRFAWGNRVLDADLKLLTTTSHPMRDMDSSGELTVSNVGIHHLPSFRTIAPLATPLLNPVFCESAGTILHLTSHPSLGSVRYAAIDYRALLELDPASIAPVPADGSLMLESAVTLSWTDLPAAALFRVFFGSDRAAVEAATAGTPLELGVTHSTSWNPPIAVARGSTYFWKVVAESPRGSVSTPVWSFETLGFELEESSFAAIAVTNGPVARRKIDLTAAAGMEWSLASDTPWIHLPQPTGNGSGALTIEADPTGLTGSQHEGLVTLTIQGLAIPLPVSFRILGYTHMTAVADNDEAVMHSLVRGPTSAESAFVQLYLIRFDMQTLLPVDIVDPGISLNSGSNPSIYLTLHEPEGRVYLYDTATATLVGIRADGYHVDRRIDLSALQPSGSTLRGIAPTIAGRLLVTRADRLTVHLCDSATGARIADVPTGTSGTWSFFPKGSPDGSRVYAGVSGLAGGGALRSYNVFPDRVEAGPEATRISGTNGFGGISGDGSTIFYLSGTYDRDLRFTGESPDGFILMNRDASRRLTSPGFNSVRWVSPDGSRLTPDLSFSGLFRYVTDPTGDVIFSRTSAGSIWLVIPETAILPAIPGSSWFSAGAGKWSAPEPGVLRSPPLITPGASDLSRSASLSSNFPSAGTLSFQWRNLTSTSERLSFFVNNSQNSVITANAAWQNHTVTLPAGATVRWNYNSPVVAAATAAAELRQITFAPTPSGLLAAVDDAPDRDGDGASDLLETALGSDPDDGADQPSTGLVRIDGGWAFQFERPADLPFDYQVEFSSDLQRWDDHPALPVVSPLGDRERVRVSVPAAGPDRRFFRLRVAPNAP